MNSGLCCNNGAVVREKKKFFFFLKKLWVKEKMLVAAFSPFPTTFSTLSKTEFLTSATHELSIANGTVFDKYTFVLFSKDLNIL